MKKRKCKYCGRIIEKGGVQSACEKNPNRDRDLKRLKPRLVEMKVYGWTPNSLKEAEQPYLHTDSFK